MATNPRSGGGGEPLSASPGLSLVGNDEEAWRARSRIVLLPTAAPSIMGLFGFMISTLMVGAWQAGWFGNATTPLVLFPFAIFAGGLAQLIAAVGCFRARDGVALAVHTAWGTFWLGWGLMQLLVATHVMAPIALGASSPAFGFWFIALAAVTASATFAALGQSISNFVVLGTLTVGSCLTAAGFWAGSLATLRTGGWLFVVSAAAAWFAATAMMLEHSYGRTVLPLGKFHSGANIPGGTASRPIQYAEGMPGSRVGQ